MFKNPEKIVRVSTIFTLTFMVLWGMVVVFAQIKPFWVDEWRVIYNLKFKDAAALWGPLDFMQQFPRVYLEIIKAFTSFFDYSYFTLRLPSYMVGTFTIIFCYRLMNRIYPHGQFNRFLFVMILVSCSTFTGYYVQIKQYTMDLLLSLVAIWQLIELIRLDGKSGFRYGAYAGLCASFLFLPFFSYTYPIAITPVFLVVLIQGIRMIKRDGNTPAVRKTILLQCLPLVLAAISMAVFYKVDVAQLMADKDMRQFWGHLMLDSGFSWKSFFFDFYNLFAEVGAGFLFWLIFGVLGITVFVFGLYRSAGDIKNGRLGESGLIRLYAAVLFILVIILFLLRKFPVGEPRLNAFTIPSLSILIIYFLDNLGKWKPTERFARVMAAILYAGLIGNIYTTFFASITGQEYARKMNIYKCTEDAIIIAQAKKLPILITPEVAYPYDKTQNFPFQNTIPGDWVLKTFPAYKVAENIPVYAITDMQSLPEYIGKLPPYITAVMAGDGSSFRIIKR